MRLGRGLVLTLLLGGGALAACQLIAGIDDRTIYDAGADAEGGIDPCLSTNVPLSPGPDASSPSDSKSFTMALSAVMLGQTDGGPYYGFNLDKACTCPGPSSCTSSDRCDDDGGIDNYARRIFEQINSLSPDGGFISQDSFNSTIKKGLSGALIKVSNWNGNTNDSEVTVTVFSSVGFAGLPAAPKFDGTDVWNVDPTSATGQYNTANAYIANGTLVAGLDFPIIVNSSTTQPVYIQLRTGLIEAALTIDTSGNVTELTGVLGGRWDPAKFLPSLAVVPDPLGSGYLCPDASFTYEIVKATICNNTDINVDPSQDGVGLCNAVSMGLGFQAVPAIVGSPVAPPDSGSPCQGNTDHCQ